MNADIKTLKRLASANELQVIHYPDGRILVVGGLIPVHWWPDSKRRTAYVEGAPKGYSFASPKSIINLAIKGTFL